MRPHIQAHLFQSTVESAELAIDQHVFPGMGLSVIYQNKAVLWLSLGKFTYDLGSTPVAPATSFDLASLTKVIATTTMAMLLYERGLLKLDQTVCEVVPEFRSDEKHNNDARRYGITYRMLLAHCSGLPAHRRFFEETSDREQLLKLAFATPLEADPMAKAEYSDIGFIILGVALERIAGETLDGFCKREIFEPLKMENTRFCPATKSMHLIPPTIDDKVFRKKVIQGEVNDENAWVMGGVAGHAGLFAPATDVAKFAQCILRGGAPILRPETVKLFTTRQELPRGTTRALGWDTPSSPSQSGKYFCASSFGHLGYTGTSLWIDPERGLAITLLTNRTWPDNSSQAIKQVRPALHDSIIEALDSNALNSKARPNERPTRK